jgi:hypothetical protein
VSLSAGPEADKRGAREDMWAVRADAFQTKSKTKMSARGRIRTLLSVWVVPLSRVFCLREHVRMHGEP